MYGLVPLHIHTRRIIVNWMRTQHFPLKIVTLLCLGLLVLSACAPSELPYPFSEWQFTDVKVLDDDLISHSEQISFPDLLALYLRQSGQDLQLRLDFFDLGDRPDFDLHLAFDTVAGGVELPDLTHTNFAWDTLVRISASGQIEVQDAHGRPVPQARLQVYRDPILDHLVLSASRDILPAGLPGYQVLAWLTPPNSGHVLDTLPVAFSENRPVQSVQLLMAFSDSFPAYTPAQALRRWDGAHTGPSGGRHGLYNLLRITDIFHAPVVLLDLLNPSSLSALDYMGNLETVQAQMDAGLVIAPQYAPAIKGFEGTAAGTQLLDAWYELNRESIQNFGMRQPLLLYSPSGYVPGESPAKLVFLPNEQSQGSEKGILPTQAIRRQDKILLPSPKNLSITQASTGGPTLELKLAIASAMQTSAVHKPGSIPDLLVLGGSLPASTWGDPQAARATLRYLASRPWLHFLGENDLLTLKVSPTGGERFAYASEATPSPYSQLWQAIKSAPPNDFSLAARQAFLAAANPVYPQPAELPQLREIYLQQAWALLSAAEWAKNPYPHSSCELDLDQDGFLDCSFSNNYLYAFFEPASGALTHLFYRQPETGTSSHSLHQLIGPTAQIISGLSESSTWDLTAGLRADPAILQGAFDQPEKMYTAQSLADGIRFTSPDGSQKTYQFTHNSLSIHYTAPAGSDMTPQSILLMPDPWLRFSPGWWSDDALEAHQGQWRMKWVQGVEVLISASLPLSARSFLDSRTWMSATENPNHEQPGGHFLPFPTLMLDLPAANQFEATIQFFQIDE